ncbi:carbohydrate kinase [Burkholderia pseudomallei]|nr:carbohydrate kinase [Burkholderia pseudomallei]MBF3670297.1 carbohydrate kinase [Burkholderia pseudomallei]MBF3776048.1 carbohydrate kinase [Burkholderia pseudomallei]
MRFLGIDLGTGSLKLAIVDGDGRVRASSGAAYAVATPQPGWAEIDVAAWWRALVDAATRLPEQERARVRAIGFSGQMHGVVLTGASGSALRPALLWPDARATALAGPDGDWDDDLIASLGLPRTLFATPRAPDARCGALSADAARTLGLHAGIALATGAGDTPCAALGSGLARDGDALLTTGTGGQIVVLTAQGAAPRAGLHRYRAAGGTRYYTMAAMQNVGIALESARGWLVYPDWRAAYDDAFGAGAAPQISFLPYLTGERSPWMNPAARGGWLGLSLGDSRGALMRAAFEGVAFALRAGLDAIRADGSPVRALRLAGGGSVEPRWRQLLADALDVELHAVDGADAAARGAALLGGVAAGHWHAAELAPGATRVAAPAHDAALAARHTRFIELYRRTQGWFGAGG